MPTSVHIENSLRAYFNSYLHCQRWSWCTSFRTGHEDRRWFCELEQNKITLSNACHILITHVSLCHIYLMVAMLVGGWRVNVWMGWYINRLIIKFHSPYLRSVVPEACIKGRDKSHSIYGIITCPCPWYLPLAHHSVCTHMTHILLMTFSSSFIATQWPLGDATVILN